MVEWHRRLDGHEFEQAPGDGERQGSLVCCSPLGNDSNRLYMLFNKLGKFSFIPIFGEFLS